MTADRDRPEPRSYGRKRGRKLRPGRARLMETLLPRIVLALPDEARTIDEGTIDPGTLFDPPPREVWLEIGFGAGEHLAWQAAHNPQVGLIGCEVFEYGVGALLSRIDEASIDNIRVLYGDAVPLLDALPDASIARAFVLFPDPWPKARHWKRRLIGEAGLARLARILADGAELRIGTDHPGYLVWMLRHILAAAEFEWLANSADDWRKRPADWPETRYEAKAIREGRRGTYLRLRRRPR